MDLAAAAARAEEAERRVGGLRECLRSIIALMDTPRGERPPTRAAIAELAEAALKRAEPDTEAT
jgi:hypothetical protein